MGLPPHTQITWASLLGLGEPLLKLLCSVLAFEIGHVFLTQ